MPLRELRRRLPPGVEPGDLVAQDELRAVRLVVAPPEDELEVRARLAGPALARAAVQYAVCVGAWALRCAEEVGGAPGVPLKDRLKGLSTERAERCASRSCSRSVSCISGSADALGGEGSRWGVEVSRPRSYPEARAGGSAPNISKGRSASFYSCQSAPIFCSRDA